MDFDASKTPDKLNEHLEELIQQISIPVLMVNDTENHEKK